MSKYNVGDVVKLRDDLEDDKEYGCGICFVSSMNHLKRKPVVIEVCEKESYGEWYRVEDAYWNITDEMIEGLWEECNTKKQDAIKLIDVLNMIAKGELKEGTKVKIRDYVYVLRRQYCSDVMPDLFREDEDGDEVVSLFEDYYLSGILNDECELIEPPCEHEWLDWETHRMGEGIIRRFRRCVKCGLEEVTEERNVGADKTIEPTDNTTEKIEELRIKVFRKDYFEFRELDKGFMDNFLEIQYKLNEVIRYINKEG